MTASPPSTVLTIARSYVSAGLSVIPVGLDGLKQPAFDVLPRAPDPERADRVKPTWKPFEERLPIDDELERWFGRKSPYGIAVACGAVSGGAECIDFDDKETAREFRRIVKGEEPALYALLSLESTPRGLHVWYTTDVGEGNRALAGRPDGFDAKGRPKSKKTIETRGQGGYAIVAGSPLAVHELGLPYEYVAGPPLTALSRISGDDRDYLFRQAMSFDCADPRPQQDRQREHRSDELSPGDDYDLRGPPFSELLPDAKFSDTGDGISNVRRPGKDRGNSATVGRCKGRRGEPLLKVFTSNWPPFEAEQCYGRFNVLRLTRFGGDGAEATRFLRGEGFGSPQNTGNPERNGKHASARQANGPREEGGEQAGQAETTDVQPLEVSRFADVTPVLDEPDFVEELLTDEGMSVVYGDSGSGKTFFVLDVCLHVAGGVPWRGKEVDRGGVIYLALEGSDGGIRNRLAAYKMARQCNAADLWFAFATTPVNLFDSDADVDRVIATIRAEAARLGGPVRLVVVDTLSRAMAGGNENTSEDMGALVRNIDRIRKAGRAHLCLIHHSGKDAAKGARGHSSLRAATDTEIEVVADKVTKTSVATVTKQRDLELVGEFPFRLERVELGKGKRRGKPVTSCVVRPEEAEPAPSKEDRAAQALLEKERQKKVAEAAAEEELCGQALGAVRDAMKQGHPGASRTEIRKAVIARRNRADAIIDALLEAGRLVKTAPFKKFGGKYGKTPVNVDDGYAIPATGDGD